MVELDEITGAIIEAGLEIHRGLGPGMLESVYERIMERMLLRRGLFVERQKSVSFVFDGLHFDDGFRVDLVVERQVVVELKSAERITPAQAKQLLTYLRLMKLPVGLLMNFGAPTLKDGIHRVVNHLPPSASPRLRVNQPQSDDTRIRPHLP